MPVANQAQRSVSFVFVLDTFWLAGRHRNRVSNAFGCLKTRHLIDADDVRVFLAKQAVGGLPDAADFFHLSFKRLAIFLFRVEPILAAMRLQPSRPQEPPNAADGNFRHDFSLYNFVGKFAGRPFFDRAIRLRGWFAGGCQNLSDLFAGEFPTTPAARCVAQNIFDGSDCLGERLTAFDRNACFERCVPASSPEPDLLSPQRNFFTDVLVGLASERQQYYGCSRDKSDGRRCRRDNFLSTCCCRSLMTTLAALPHMAFLLEEPCLSKNTIFSEGSFFVAGSFRKQKRTGKPLSR